MRQVERSLWAWFFVLLELSSFALGSAAHIAHARADLLGAREPAQPLKKESKKKRTNLSKRSVADLLEMSHPDFTGDHWLETFRLHVAEMHARGHQLTLRQAPLPADMVEAAFAGSTAKFEVDDEAARLSSKPEPRNVSYTQVPVNSKEILEGIITGIAGVFVPGLKEAENGTEALATFQQCFDPRKLHETFVIKDFFKAQDELPSVSDADLDAFQQSIEQMDQLSGAGALNPQALLRRFDALQQRTWRTWKYLAAILKKLSPYLLQLLKHSSRCGVIDIVIGFALSFVLPFFPPILLLLIAVAAMAFELFTQIKAAVDNWYKNWFKFGKATGAILAFVASLIISYKMGKSSEIKCTGGKQKGCTYEMPKNEMNNWQPPGKGKKYCGGELCNPVMQRNDIIDPNRLDNLGRTNIERMKAGSAAIGPDGKSINLHHIYQTPDGPIAELTDTFHSVNHEKLHTFLKHGEPSRIDRDAFAVWRSAYWRQRGQEMEAAIKAGEYVATFGASVPNWAPVAATALTKSWDSAAANAPKVGDFLGTVLTALANGDAKWNVTAVKDGMGSLDLVRLILVALKGTVTRSANEMDASMMSAPAMAANPKMACSLDAACAAPVALDAMRFDRVDGLVENKLQKQYTVHFAPDTGLALSLSTFVNEGAMRVRVTSARYVATADGVRDAEKLVKTGELESEFANAEHRVTLQHCDGYGDYTVELLGDRAPLSPDQWASSDGNATWRAFWLANGAPPEMDKSIYTVGAQYVPYPVVPAAAAPAALVAEPLAVSVGAAEGTANRYHVFLAPMDAPAVATVCDVLRVAKRAGTATTPLVPIEQQPEAKMRAYVIVQNSAGAMTLYQGSTPAGETAVDKFHTVVPGAASSSATIGIAVGVSLLLIFVIVAAVLVVAWKKGMLARFRRH